MTGKRPPPPPPPPPGVCDSATVEIVDGNEILCLYEPSTGRAAEEECGTITLIGPPGNEGAICVLPAFV